MSEGDHVPFFAHSKRRAFLPSYEGYLTRLSRSRMNEALNHQNQSNQRIKKANPGHSAQGKDLEVSATTRLEKPEEECSLAPSYIPTPKMGAHGWRGMGLVRKVAWLVDLFSEYLKGSASKPSDHPVIPTIIRGFLELKADNMNVNGSEPRKKIREMRLVGNE